MSFDSNNRQHLQEQVLGHTTASNPGLPDLPPPFGRALRTQNRIITLAINEVLNDVNIIRDTVSSSLSSFQDVAIGNYLDDISINQKLNDLNGTIIEALHKVYSTLVGDLNNPVQLDEGNVVQSIIDLKESIKEIKQTLVGDPENPTELENGNIVQSIIDLNNALTTLNNAVETLGIDVSTLNTTVGTISGDVDALSGVTQVLSNDLQNLSNEVEMLKPSPIEYPIESQFEYDQDGKLVKELNTNYSNTLVYDENGNFEKLLSQTGDKTVVHSLVLNGEGQVIGYKQELLPLD